jgi:hypothetical protein
MARVPTQMLETQDACRSAATTGAVLDGEIAAWMAVFLLTEAAMVTAVVVMVRRKQDQEGSQE